MEGRQVNSAGSGQSPRILVTTQGRLHPGAAHLSWEAPRGPLAPRCHPACFFLGPWPSTTGAFSFLKIKGPSVSFPAEVSESVPYESVLLSPQLAQLVIDLNNQMQQKDREMQMNEAK